MVLQFLFYFIYDVVSVMTFLYFIMFIMPNLQMLMYKYIIGYSTLHCSFKYKINMQSMYATVFSIIFLSTVKFCLNTILCICITHHINNDQHQCNC